jgi:hypothetical protein
VRKFSDHPKSRPIRDWVSPWIASNLERHLTPKPRSQTHYVLLVQTRSDRCHSLDGSSRCDYPLQGSRKHLCDGAWKCGALNREIHAKYSRQSSFRRKTSVSGRLERNRVSNVWRGFAFSSSGIRTIYFTHLPRRLERTGEGRRVPVGLYSIDKGALHRWGRGQPRR